MTLAGESVHIKLPAPLPKTAIGFMHYPADAKNDVKTVRLMITALAAMIAASSTP